MQRGFDRMQQGMERMQAAAERFRGAWQRPGYQAAGASQVTGPGSQASSGNRAFDEYRTETLRRLEDEQREFLEFLERLRHAKDKAEFDQFMAERRAIATSRRQRRSSNSQQPPRQLGKASRYTVPGSAQLGLIELFDEI